MMQPFVFTLTFVLVVCGRSAANGQTAPGPAVADSTGVCVIVDGQLVEHHPAFGDTAAGGGRLAEVYPVASPPYLAGADWYARDEMVFFEGRRYVSYGRPRVLQPAVLTRVGEFKGVPLFAGSRGDAFRLVYALVNQRCEFQPYWYAATVGAVRGR